MANVHASLDTFHECFYHEEPNSIRQKVWCTKVCRTLTLKIGQVVMWSYGLDTDLFQHPMVELRGSNNYCPIALTIGCEVFWMLSDCHCWVGEGSSDVGLFLVRFEKVSIGSSWAGCSHSVRFAKSQGYKPRSPRHAGYCPIGANLKIFRCSTSGLSCQCSVWPVRVWSDFLSCPVFRFDSRLSPKLADYCPIGCLVATQGLSVK